ncbi:hypothetical protein CAPTEDRAFT_205460 [Capitella teleta]|uniref:Ubiquitin-like domain-containing protein n=1 Tax=Capitella teleta TaxID=283909 RepID=R7UPP6_CAPTE|nr:hypothetical protein CAPTEDRAFT_205460 [Capitella teleta]|eukprot:ELU05406.1 hypothetical protein CAPTEDRAFT_205460 [Capitella teleta]
MPEFSFKKSSSKMEDDNLEVLVKFQTGPVHSFSMTPCDTIRNVCRELAAKLDVPEERLRISFTGKVLQKNNSLGYLGVRPETILKAEIIECKMLKLSIQRNDQETDFNVEIENFSPVRFIKNQIEATTGIVIAKQVLKLNGAVLKNDEMILMEAGIKNNSNITLTVESDINAREIAAENDKVDDNDDLADAEKEELLKSFRADGQRVEVVFCFDTTGSMYPCLEKVRENLRSTITRLLESIPDIRIGIMAHGDYCDYRNYVTKHIDLTTNINALVEFVETVGSTGGGDAPECYEWALRKAQGLDWAEDSAKAFVLIGDALPHPASFTDQNVNWRSEVDVLAGMAVKVYGIQALNNSSAKPFYQEIARRTGGAYVSFKNFSVITEMFLAVCYREVSDEHYDQFCEDIMETKENGTVMEDIRDVLQQLKTPAVEDTVEPQQEEDWWQPPYFSHPVYKYNQESDSWTSATHSSGIIAKETARRESGKRKPKRNIRGYDAWYKCIVM